jgi:hypothetical protein
MNNHQPTTAGRLDISKEGMLVPERPKPLQSITAAASRLTSTSVKRYTKRQANGRAAEAWEMFDLVGEEHFLATTLARRMAQAKFFVGRIPDDDDTGEPVPVEPGDPADVLDLFGKNSVQRAQMIERAGVGLFVPGETYFVGVPPYLYEARDGSAGGQVQRLVQTPTGRIEPDGGLYAPDGTPIDLRDLDWYTLSNDEVSWGSDDDVTLTLGKRKVTTLPDAALIIRAWQAHPRMFVETDSPTMAALPILRELTGLTEHVSSQIDSRLAGAGLFAIAKSVKDAMSFGSGDENEDAFTEALMDAMITPISDRSNASAHVPLIVTVPDDGTGRAVADYFHYQRFDSELDAQAQSLREEAIRRLALSLDTPPEILLGVGSMNHWGAWLVREDVIVTHVEPPLALLCDALTREFLWPVLMADGMPEEEAEKHVIWYSVAHLVTRPNKTDDAKDLHDKGVISDAALRRETGFSDEDAPEVSAEVEQDPAVTLALGLVAKAPTLLASPGLPAIVAQIQAVLDGNIPDAEAVMPSAAEPAAIEAAPAPTDDDDDTTDEGAMPETDNDSADLEGDL